MFVAKNITQTITIFEVVRENGMLASINKQVVDNVFIDYKGLYSVSGGNNVKVANISLMIPYNEVNFTLEREQRFIIGTTDVEISSIKDIPKPSYVITEINECNYGYNKHYEIGGV